MAVIGLPSETSLSKVEPGFVVSWKKSLKCIRRSGSRTKLHFYPGIEVEFVNRRVQWLRNGSNYLLNFLQFRKGKISCLEIYMIREIVGHFVKAPLKVQKSAYVIFEWSLSYHGFRYIIHHFYQTNNVNIIFCFVDKY